MLPFWQSDPPRHRLTAKPYKSIWAKNSYLPENSLTFKVRSPPSRTLFPCSGRALHCEQLQSSGVSTWEALITKRALAPSGQAQREHFYPSSTPVLLSGSPCNGHQLLSSRMSRWMLLLVLQRLRLRQGLRVRAIALGLRVAGHRSVADRLLSGWKVHMPRHHVTPQCVLCSVFYQQA